MWKCKICQVPPPTLLLFYEYDSETKLINQKTNSASVTAGPNTYEADEKRKGQKVLDFDCRGLELTEFKPDVRFPSHMRSSRMDTRLHWDMCAYSGLGRMGS